MRRVISNGHFQPSHPMISAPGSGFEKRSLFHRQGVGSRTEDRAHGEVAGPSAG